MTVQVQVEVTPSEDSFIRDCGGNETSTPLPSPIPSDNSDVFTPSFKLHLDNSLVFDTPVNSPVKLPNCVSRLVTRDELQFQAVKGFGGFKGIQTLEEYIEFNKQLDSFF